MKKPSTHEDVPGRGGFELTSISANRLLLLAAILQDIPGSSTNRQRQRLRAVMEQTGSVSTYEAMRYLDCYDPRPRIFELRHKTGLNIATVRETTETESGKPHRIGRYVLLAANDAEGRP